MVCGGLLWIPRMCIRLGMQKDILKKRPMRYWFFHILRMGVGSVTGQFALRPLDRGPIPVN